jgi:hypothetical protein
VFTENDEQHGREIFSVLPNRRIDLERLQALLGNNEPVVTVIGKYNHGKSRLLNELIGKDTFAVADKRETVKLSNNIQQGVCWLDAPGLDADVGTQDDRHALHAAWLVSDIRLFVHAAKEGELDSNEQTLLAELRADSERTQRQTIFVLSQVDQLPDDDELRNVAAAINSQVSALPLHAVSSTRHRKGIEGGKTLLVERSGIPALRSKLDAALLRVPEARAHETALLFSEIFGDLVELRAQQESALAALVQTHRQQRHEFDIGLVSVIEKVSRDIDAMLNSLGIDHAILPDTAQDAYRITAGKLERAHIQIAYSKACIELDGFLAGHGVISLPTEQQTSASSLNSVMIAVMGVSVKFRKDLRRIFCEPSGLSRLQRDFSHFYELSTDRKSLSEQIDEVESSIRAIDRSRSFLETLRDRK